MPEEQKYKKYEIEYVDYKLIEKNKWNPNHQSNATFDNLSSSIEEEGCDEPIIVVKMSKDKYRIIGGEHRYKACIANGITEIPCIIKEGGKWMDESFQKTETVRRNNLRGSLDNEKFTDLVREVIEETDASYSEISHKTGFDSEADFMKHIFEDRENLDREVRKYTRQQEDQDKKEIKDVNNISEIANVIVNEYGNTLKSGFIWFYQGNQMNLYVKMDKSLESEVENLVDYLTNSSDTDISGFLQDAINNQLTKLINESIP